MRRRRCRVLGERVCRPTVRIHGETPERAVHMHAGPTAETHLGRMSLAEPLEVAARAVQDRLGIAVAHFYPWRVMSTWGPKLFGDDWKAVYGHGAEPNTSCCCT